MAKTVAFRIVLQGQEVVIRNTKELKDALKAVRNELATAEFGGAKFTQLSEAQAKLLNVQGRLQQQTRQTKNELKASGQEAEIVKGSYEQLSARLSVLTARWRQMGAAARNGLQGQRLEREIKGVSDELAGLDAKIGRFQRNVGNYGSAFDSLSFRFKDFVKGGFIIAGVNLLIEGFQRLASEVIPINARVSDSLADIQRVTGATTVEAQALLNTLKGFDTRTGLDDLLSFAVIGGKLGVPTQELGEFTQALDGLKVALGGELGGDVEEVANKLGKLNNVFDVTGNTTGERLLKIGNAIVDLANRGVATGEFLSDFGERLAGIAEISGITLGQVLGLGAGFEELGQTAEVSSTAVNQAILLIGKDLDNVARITGISRKELKRLFDENPAEALIRVSEALTSNAAGLEEISKGFAEFGSDGRRAVAVLGVLGKNADFFREKITLANDALEKTDEITIAVALKQNTLAASTEKLKNAFVELVQGPGVTSFLKSIVDTTTSVIDSFSRLGDKIPELGKIFLGATILGSVSVREDQISNVSELYTKLLDSRKAIENIEGPVLKLLARYDQLNAVTKLTAKEQEEFSKVLAEFGRSFPAATTFDKQGKAIGLNKEKLFELIDAQVELEDFTRKRLITAAQAEINLIEKKIELNDKEIASIKAKKATAANLGQLQVELQREFDVRRENEQRLAALRAVIDEANEIRVKKSAARTKAVIEQEIRDAQKLLDNAEPGEIAGIKKRIADLQRELKNLLGPDEGEKVGRTFSEGFVRGSLGYLKEQISKLQKELENVVDPDQYLKVFQQTLKVQEQLAAKEREFEKARVTGAGGSLVPDPLPQLQTIDQAVTDLLNNIGINFFEAESSRAEGLFENLDEFDRRVKKSNKEQLFENNEQREKDLQKQRENNRILIREYADMVGQIGELFGQIGQIQQNAAEARIAQLQRLYNREIELAEGNTQVQAELRQRLDDEIQEIEREAFERQKRLQIAQALISGAQAIVSTLAAVPGPADILSLGALRGIQVALVAATTAAQIAAIESQGFEQGKESPVVGYTGHGSTKEVAGVVHRDEEVIPSRTLHHPKAAGHIMELRKISRALGYSSAKPTRMGFELGRPSPLLAQSPVSNSVIVENTLGFSPAMVTAIQQAVAQGSAMGTKEGARVGMVEAQRNSSREVLSNARAK